LIRPRLYVDHGNSIDCLDSTNIQTFWIHFQNLHAVKPTGFGQLAQPRKSSCSTLLPLPRRDPHCQVGGGRSCVVKDKAGIGSFLESGKTRGEQRHPGQHIPYADDSHEVGRVAQVLHDPDERW
jgi:hypothetical protein